MCQLIYIGSSADLGELPFNAVAPGFYYRRITSDEQGYDSVQRLLPLPYLYFMGGSQGCSCTLTYTEPWENAPELNAEREIAMAEVGRMLTFLNEQLQRAELLLLCTWWDKAEAKMDVTETYMLTGLGDTFEFPLDKVLRLQSR
ncbi:MAG: hypothetical protein IPO05_19250 [Flavobacteriales bacterium]|jgi:hypothetical protein|nr:hypothetical protein [Flavobacteriales bacterium]MBK9515687.1 hypothetical protein [Flavobacteriales bacterium]HOZ41433.1 hypothetical protein [Flavobacteriales bacterium]